MNIDEKNKLIKQYIANVATQVNNQYPDLMDVDKMARAYKMFENSPDDLEKVIIPKINELAKRVVEDYIQLQKMLEEMMKRKQDEQLDTLATLDLETEKNGIYLSQQQIDLLMITEINSKEELKNYVENICSQFPYMRVQDIITNFDTISNTEQLEDAKRYLYQRYQNGLINYLDNAQMSDVEKAKVKLERLGIHDQELEECLLQIAQGRIKETFVHLGQKYGNDFIIKFNRSMNDDFENIQGVSYDEMKSLSELIKSNDQIDTIIIATGKYDNTIYPTLNGMIFDPYLTQKALGYCIKHNKHMRYHALFDQAHVDNLIKQGKGLKDHDQILADMKEYIRLSIQFIEKNNRLLSDGTMIINTVEIFNELIEKNKTDKHSHYSMVWEKYFGITIEEILSCFDEIKKPNGVEFMYNETTLTENSQKRKTVERILFQIDSINPNLIDSFGDQMHLSDEDITSEEGRKNLTEAAQMIKRIQDGKLVIDGQIKDIKPKKTECTEHDFHFTRTFLDKIGKLKMSGKSIKLWDIKRGMQSLVSQIYTENGVKFEKTTYWSIFGKNDHNLCRENIKIQEENTNKRNKGLPETPLVETMSAGIVPDKKTFYDIKRTKDKNKEKTKTLIRKNDNTITQSNGFIDIFVLVLTIIFILISTFIYIKIN